MQRRRSERRRKGGRREGRKGKPRRRREKRIRAFFAFEIPSSLRFRISSEMDRLKRSLPPARWVRPEGLHVTIKFLGSVPKPKLDRLVAGLKERLSALDPVTIKLEGAGFFPSPSQARVVWIGGRATGIEDVVEEVEAAAVMEGFPKEKQPFKLHVTLARLDTPWPRYAADELLAWGQDFKLEEFVCKQLVCFESKLLPGGAVYTPIHTIPLGGEL